MADSETKGAEPVAAQQPKAEAPRKRVKRIVPVDPIALERKYQDELDLLLRRAMAVGIPPEKLLAKASVQRGVGMFERFTDSFFNALEGKKR